jgi:hypothetical protein
MSDDHQGTVSDTTAKEDDESSSAGAGETLESVIKDHIDSRDLLRAWWNRQAECDRKTVKSCLSRSLHEQQMKFKELYARALGCAYSDDNDFDKGWRDLYAALVTAGLLPQDVRGRVASLTLGLDQDYRGEFDLLQFQGRIHETFLWHEKGDERNKYISPSFAIIQSSGMGKTKLMKQYKTVTNDTVRPSDTLVRLLLCVHGETIPPKDHTIHFDALLPVPNLQNLANANMDDQRRKLIKHLDDIVDKALAEPRTETKIVLLIDEAHILVKEREGGFYVALRWWLRQVRRDGRQIVAVFAGTLLSLANYQQIAPSQGWTRDADVEYCNYATTAQPDDDKKKKLYNPFYTFTTMAMEHVRVTTDAWDTYKDALHDIRNCGYFGRPLFAAMLKADKNDHRELTLLEENVSCINGTGHIANARLHSIMARVLLSKPVGWKYSHDSIASVLATRVQLGIASYDFAAKVTSKGYGNLVHFRGVDNSDNRSLGTASIAFPPDPVCAALAMGLMQDSWALSTAGPDSTDIIKGASPVFWVKEASVVFEQQLFLPYQGDAGEVFAALYMLLCGDELRKVRDPCLRMFAIDLRLWLNSLVAGSKKRDHPDDLPENLGVVKKGVRRSRRLPKQPTMVERTTAAEPSGVLDRAGLTLNFIQVVWNYFRTHAWFFQRHLKFMYDTAVACYVYPNCPAFDLVFAIRDATTEKFHPAFVSIKCWDSIGHADMKNAVNDMATYLNSYREEKHSATKALCILMVIGYQHVGPSPQGKGNFPAEDAFVTIVVPEKDKFDVSAVIIKCAASSVRAEVLASHPFAHVEDNNHFASLRVSTKPEDREFGYGVLGDQGAVEEDHEA